MKGILDRFENDQAVILIEEINEEVIFPKSELPAGSDVNTYFTIEKRDDGYHIIAIDQEKTKNEAQTTSDLMKTLKAKNKGSKFKR